MCHPAPLQYLAAFAIVFVLGLLTQWALHAYTARLQRSAYQEVTP